MTAPASPAINRLIKPSHKTKFHIDFDWWERESREFRVYLTSHLCPEHQAAFAADPRPYGLKSSGKVVETIAQYVHEQGLTPRRVALEEVFAPQALDL